MKLRTAIVAALLAAFCATSVAHAVTPAISKSDGIKAKPGLIKKK